jgi:hypothetical protein
MALHGIHHVAQKSTITTPFMVSSTKLEVVRVTMFLSDDPDLHDENVMRDEAISIIKRVVLFIFGKD